MPVRNASTKWQGSLEAGTGEVEFTSSKLPTVNVSFPRRAADDAQGVTSPEELIAAAHTSCFAMQFSALLGAAGGEVENLNVSAAVHLGPDGQGGFEIPKIELTVSGSASGISAEQFEQIAGQAKETCPVSKALAGTNISLTVN